MIITHNLFAMNANGEFKKIVTGKNKSTEKLSSGYRINRAADDAAGLTISEKMRSLIRGLNQGTKNAQDGVSWTQIGDGALQDVHDMLHRMSELTIQSLNETNTDDDRAAMQQEFNQLQTEIDRITQSTEFNTLNIFEEHEPTYYQYVGNVDWPQDEPHNIVKNYNDTLVVNYKTSEDAPENSLSITVPQGQYTTQELIDEIDMYLEKSGGENMGFRLEMTGPGTVNVNYDGGSQITSISGGLQYLIHDMSQGSSMGTLIGTTVFPSEDSKLNITSENNTLDFDILDADGNKISHSPITLSSGRYTRQQLIDALNENLAYTQVKAEAYGDGIRLYSDEALITRFKGNMFKIETSQPIYTSVFYDNVKYGDINLTPGTYKGGAVLNLDTKDKDHSFYNIDSTNNTLEFKPNDSETATTITIPEGKYNAAQMAEKLNELFVSNGLDLTANRYASGGFEGLEITSKVVNLNSRVGLEGGSAVDTLFKTKTYNVFSNNASKYTSYQSSYASTTSARSYSESKMKEYPLDIKQGINDSFKLSLESIDGTKTEKTITISEGQYTTSQSVADAINTAIAADEDLKDKIYANITSIGLEIKSTKGANLYAVKVNRDDQNTGYDVLFRNVSRENNAVAGKKITLNQTVGETMNITNSKLYIQGGGTVNLPTGSDITRQQVLDAINDQLKSVENNVTFSTLNVNGSTRTTSSINNSGNTIDHPNDYSVTGSTFRINQGEADSAKNTTDTWAATKPTTKGVGESTVIGTDNNSIKIAVNGVTKTITLASNTYSRTGLQNEIQTKLNEAFGDEFGGAKVSVNKDTGKISFEVVHGEIGDGEKTSIALKTSESSFLNYVEQDRTPGTAVSYLNINSSVNLDSTNNKFTFNYSSNGVNQTKSIDLTHGTYGRQQLIDEINKQLKNASIPLNADLDGSKLRLTTNSVGTGNSVSFYPTGENDAFSTAVFTDYKASATGTIEATVQSSISIGTSNNVFSLNVNGVKYDLEIAPSDTPYSRDDFVNALNKAMQDKNVPAKVQLSNGKLQFTSTTKGNDSNIKVSYDDGGSAMRAIYGTTKTPTITATFEGNHLVLETTGSSIAVDSAGGNIFQTGSSLSYYGDAAIHFGGKTKSYIDGINITEPVVINEYNKDFKFTYTSDGVSKNVDITLDEKSYSFDELKTELKSKIDEDLGEDLKGELEVSVSTTGVRIEAKYSGNSYTMSSFSGGFYDRVINSAKERTDTLTPSVHNGDEASDSVFVVGRRNIHSKATEIIKDINDELSFDFTAAGKQYSFNFNIDQGTYSGQELVNQIQEKLNEQLKNNGLKENFIIAQIGGVNTGVIGSNDENALVFKMSENDPLPNGSGQYVIDGVGGSAAFTMFYQTVGDTTTAYTTGTKDITNGVTLEEGETVLNFTYDGNPVTIDLAPAGSYTAEEIVKKINDQIENKPHPIAAMITEKGNLKLYSKKFGSHLFDDVEGSAKSQLFFEEQGRANEESEDIRIQLSSIQDDYETIERRRMGTCYLDINSITISQEKYAKRALDKLQDALNGVSEIRSYFGATQNRIEHSIANNDNKAENTTAAESRIRDTDMAKEMVELTKQNILAQVGQSIMAQANQSTQGVLSLLQ